MPKALHKKLKKKANKMGLSDKKENAYVYGTLNKVKSKGKKSYG